jgi:hypothetical protein
VKPGVVAFLAALVLPLAACAGRNSDATTTTGEWDGPPTPHAAGNLEVVQFNDYLADRSEYATSPIIAASRFLRLDRVAAGTTLITAESTEEGQGPTTVTVTLDGLGDDSVRGQRVVLVFEPNGSQWQLVSGKSEQRCWPGRGHQDYSPELCL